MSTQSYIHDDVISRVVPNYDEEDVVLFFKNEELYEEWYKNEVSLHGVWLKRISKTYDNNLQFENQVLAQPLPLYSVFFLCHHSGKPQSQLNYKWQHVSHNPAETEEFMKSRLPDAVKEWLEKYIKQNFDWKQIKNILRIDQGRLEEIENNLDFCCLPRALFIKYKDVKNRIKARIAKMTRKNSDVKEIVKLWVEFPKEENYTTMLEFFETILLSSLGFPHGEKKMLEDADEWCIDSTHKTCKLLNNSLESICLFTIVVRSPITLKGVLVCYFVTDKEVIPMLEKWLYWLKSSFSLNIKSIIIDCIPTEITAIRNVFDTDVTILFCHWHIKRAWKTHTKKDIKVVNATNATENARDTARSSLNSMMHAKTTEEFDLSLSLFNFKFEEYGGFIHYFNKTWVPKRIMVSSLEC